MLGRLEPCRRRGDFRGGGLADLLTPFRELWVVF